MGSVLVVDDDPTLRDLLRELLEAEGYRVLLAAEGNAALDLLRSSPYRLVVLLDYLMPSGGGKRVLEVVRRDAVLSTRHAYVLLTARTRISQPVLEVVQTLSMPVVRKPFDLDALLVTVAEAQQRLEARS
ncbi:MAG TPA: response regulator [Ktedonobacterales bacterium]|nr:response regulator [Ktedonobacterales bacterium]